MAYKLKRPVSAKPKEPKKLAEIAQNLGPSKEFGLDPFNTVQVLRSLREHNTQAPARRQQPQMLAMPPMGGSANGSIQQMAQQLAAQRGWGADEWAALNELVQHESSWNPNAQNPKSTAFGLFQFLNSTWAGTGIAKTADPRQQIMAGLQYIANRYGSPSKAWGFWQRNKWY